MESFTKPQAPSMAMLFDEISQKLDFSSCGEEGSSSDNSSDDCTLSRIRSTRISSPGAACRTPRMQRHRSRSNALSSPLQCTSPIPYASWRNLRLCDSPSTPKVGNNKSNCLWWFSKVSLKCQSSLTSVHVNWLSSLPMQSLLSKSSQPFSSTKISRHQKTLCFASAAANLIQAPSVNVNPFTPDTVRRNSEQQWRNTYRSDDDDEYGRR